MSMVKGLIPAEAARFVTSIRILGVTDAQRCASLMQASPLFAGVPAEECTALADNAIPRTYLRREMLFTQDQKITEVLLLHQGCVKLTQVSQNGFEVILRLSGSGDVAGDLGLATGGHHRVSAQALTEPCTAFAWESARFELFIDRFPIVRRNVGRLLSRRLNELEERFREIDTEKVKARVAHELVRVLNHLGRRGSSGIELRLSCEELAKLTATTLFSISRVVSGWEQEGLLVHGREAILVKDLDRLTAMSEEV